MAEIICHALRKTEDIAHSNDMSETVTHAFMTAEEITQTNDMEKTITYVLVETDGMDQSNEQVMETVTQALMESGEITQVNEMGETITHVLLVTEEIDQSSDVVDTVTQALVATSDITQPSDIVMKTQNIVQINDTEAIAIMQTEGLAQSNTMAETINSVLGETEEMDQSNDMAEPMESEDLEHRCVICERTYQNSSNLNKHVREIHQKDIPLFKTGVKCSLCTFETIRLKTLVQHLESEHNICMITETLNFDSYQEFQVWKQKTEQESNSVFTRKCGNKKKEKAEVSYYYCHRSGKFKSRGRGKRNLKVLGTNKINASCPANMKVKKLNAEGRVEVIFTKTHVGHTLDIGRVPLSEEEKRQIAEKLSQKVPVDVILDDIRDSVGDNLERKHLLTRHDVHNIQKRFHLNMENVLSWSGAVSVDDWVDSLAHLGKDSPVIFYNRQGELNSQFPCLEKDDFLLVIMNRGQREMFNIYGNDTVCMDGTHETNAYEFELTTLLVLDDKREGFPAAFILSNRQDEEMYVIAFSFIREVVDIQPNVFMSGDDPAFYNSFSRVFGPCSRHLLCTWHVDKNWRENIMKHISVQEQQVYVYKMLRCLLVETDEQAFKLMLVEAILKLQNNERTNSFCNYFQENYANRPEAWAYCHRKWSGINTNMHIKRMHRTLKYLYLEGKKMKSLDKSISALMRFVRDRQFDRLISINRGKVSSKMSKLRRNHCSVAMSQDKVITCAESPDMWEVHSASKADEVFTVQRFKECSKECILYCGECEACIHNFICTCIDNAIRWNMCKHIHLVCQLENVQPRNEPVTTLDSEKTSETAIITGNSVSALRNEEAEMHLRELVKLRSKQISFQENQAKIREMTSSLCERVQTAEDCHKMLQLLSYVTTNYNAYEENKKNEHDYAFINKDQNLDKDMFQEPVNKIMKPQKLLTARKKRVQRVRKGRTVLDKPSALEEEIAISLVQVATSSNYNAI